MFRLAGVFARFRRAKQPDPDLMQRYPLGIGSERGFGEPAQDFEVWQRQWDAIQKGIDELVADLHREPRT